ncbi:DUF3082 domain-containing protein [Senna tora]|uniref:DUF3082 domain-containing protein n=1 Tax=Senna tora TaxID=362788 RepID=A0A834X319_9FABA|nr:DUF3082 domain-containing protein [Senna tora]
MLHSHHYHYLLPNLPAPSSSLTHNIPSISLNFLHKPSLLHSISAIPPPNSPPWLSNLAQIPAAAAAEEGPIQLPPLSTPSIFATMADSSTVQVASTVLLTGAITVFLFRSVRRRAKRAKELKFRSSGVKKSIKEEAMGSLKAMGSAKIKAKKSPPSPSQALLGGLIAGVIAIFLYKFTTTIEGALNRQTVSDNFSVRQITITIRTMVNGLCYLATFIYGINSIGLFLYSGELAINSFNQSSTRTESKTNSTDQFGLSKSSLENPTNNTQSSSIKEDQTSNDDQL